MMCSIVHVGRFTLVISQTLQELVALRNKEESRMLQFFCSSDVCSIGCSLNVTVFCFEVH